HRLGVADRLQLLGFVPDAVVPELMAAADLLVHPARLDVTGTVIVEALSNQLPVVTTANCGYARYVRASGAGVVLSEPFRQEALNDALIDADPGKLAAWSEMLAGYGDDPNFYSGLERASELIEAAGDPERSSDRWATL